MKWLSLMAAAVLVFNVGCSNDKKTTKGTGEGGKVLEVTTPEALTIKQGEKKQVKVKISREKFDDPVDIDISNPPEGVTLTPSKPKVDKGVTEVTITVEASEKAPAKKGHKAMVSGSAPGVSTTNPREWTINVEAKDK